ncbi:MAG: RNA polymerase sigma factor [Desertimonas sp.]
MSPADEAITAAHRSEWGRLLALVVSRTRRLDLAEDALAESFARAAERWPVDGVPDNPAGWLYTTAWRWVVGRLRAEAVSGRVVSRLATGTGWVPPPAEIDGDLPDERLQMILLCCHPAVPADARPALALRLVIGTPTAEIARLFLVSTSTMAARLTRAKRKIVAAGIPLTQPAHDELADRLDAVGATIYLAFTAGYQPGAGADLLRADLAGEAVELAAVLHRLVPRSAVAGALLALVGFQHARRDARVLDGRLVTLAEQDRSRWHHDEIAAALALLARLAPTRGYAESLRLQAEIAAEHVRPELAVDTDWATIAARYAELEALTDSPVVRLSRAVAVAELDGAAAGLALLDGLDPALAGGHRLAAVRATLLGRDGDIVGARDEYGRAIARCANEAERAHLRARRDRLGDGPHAPIP